MAYFNPLHILRSDNDKRELRGYIIVQTYDRLCLIMARYERKIAACLVLYRTPAAQEVCSEAKS